VQSDKRLPGTYQPISSIILIVNNVEGFTTLRILGWILAPSSALERLKRQAVAAIWMGKTEGYSRAHDSTSWTINPSSFSGSLPKIAFDYSVLARRSAFVSETVKPQLLVLIIRELKETANVNIPVAKLVARLFATTALWIRIQTSLKNTKRAT